MDPVLLSDDKKEINPKDLVIYFFERNKHSECQGILGTKGFTYLFQRTHMV